MLIVTVIGMMPFAMPPIGIAAGVMIFGVTPIRWFSLGAQGV
jgi:ABC-type Fe3+ transport system permease subunit